MSGEFLRAQQRLCKGVDATRKGVCEMRYTRSVERRHTNLRTRKVNGEHGCPPSTECGERTHLAGSISIVFVDRLDTRVVELWKEESVEITLACSEEWYALKVANARVEASLCISRKLVCLLRTKSAHVEGLDAVVWVWMMIGVDEIVLRVSRMEDRFRGITGVINSLKRGSS